jgi:hypothetical protein
MHGLRGEGLHTTGSGAEVKKNGMDWVHGSLQHLPLQMLHIKKSAADRHSNNMSVAGYTAECCSVSEIGRVTLRVDPAPLIPVDESV